MRAVDAWIFLMPVCLLSACGGEEAFDDRYNQQAADLNAQANVMQQELQNRLMAGNVIDAASQEGGNIHVPTPVEGNGDGR